jgi:hypothetical protein
VQGGVLGPTGQRDLLRGLEVVCAGIVQLQIGHVADQLRGVG